MSKHEGESAIRHAGNHKYLAAAKTIFTLPASGEHPILRVALSANDGNERIQLVLPERPNPLLTRELIYTGITRAKRRLTLVESGRGMLR